MLSSLEKHQVICYNIEKFPGSLKMRLKMNSMVFVGAKQTLLDLIDELILTLEELQTNEEKGELNLYGEGAKAAFVQVVEFIQQRWDEGAEYGLDFDIEKQFPV